MQEKYKAFLPINVRSRPKISLDYAGSVLYGYVSKYNIGDAMTKFYPVVGSDNKNIKAISAGDFREPKRGEYYLSGAYVEAYKANNDLMTKYYIARLVEVEKTYSKTLIKKYL